MFHQFSCFFENLVDLIKKTSSKLAKNASRKILKACVHYFTQIFIFLSNDGPSKTMKNAFHFI